MSNKKINDLTVKQLTGLISKEDQRELDRLINENDTYRAIYEEHLRNWETAGKYTLKTTGDVHASWNQFQARLHETPTSNVFTLPFFYRVAAAIIIAIGLGWFVLNPFGSETYITEAGETLELTLPDESTVTLNESSRLVLNRNFNESDRRVELNGEAYFNVAENAAKPFIIRSGITQVKVLGTSFNVDANNPAGEVIVNVTSGRVAISEADNIENELILTPGMTGIFNSQNRTIASSTYQNQSFQSWRTGRLVFDDLKVSQVIDDISEYFGKEVTVANEAILQCRFTSTFSQPDIDEVLEIMTLALDLSIQRETETEYVLNGKGCN